MLAHLKSVKRNFPLNSMNLIILRQTAVKWFFIWKEFCIIPDWTPKLETPLKMNSEFGHFLWFLTIHFTLICYAKVPHISGEHIPDGQVQKIFHIFKKCYFHVVNLWIARIRSSIAVLKFSGWNIFWDTSLWPEGQWSAEARVCCPKMRSRAAAATTLHILLQGREKSTDIYIHRRLYNVQGVPKYLYHLSSFCVLSIYSFVMSHT